jgi:hypothetical protein
MMICDDSWDMHDDDDDDGDDDDDDPKVASVDGNRIH